MKHLQPWIRGFFLFSALLFLLSGLSLLLLPDFWIQAYPELPSSPLSLRQQGLGACVAALGLVLVSLKPERHAAILLLSSLMLLSNSLLYLFQAESIGLSLGIFCGVLFLWGLLLAAAMLRIRPSFTRRTAVRSGSDTAGEPLAKTLSRFRTQRGNNLLKLSNEQPVLVLFLEEQAFAGSCVLSKMITYAEKQLFSKLDRRSIATVFVHTYSEDSATEHFRTQGMGDAQRISDPNGLMYTAFNIQQKREQQGLRERLGRFMPAPSGESANGLAAAFLISKGQILKSSLTAADDMGLGPLPERKQAPMV